jgi:UDP-N-acetylmuramate--alanine ligase
VPDEAPLDVVLRVPGAHNARNAAGALAALAAAGANPADAAAALADFTGVGRRFELRGTVAGATIVDDYAHNPAKVAAVIDAARTQAPARVVVCFQPHLYSRTAASAHAFGAALAGADEVVVTEIYAARERPVAGVTAKLVVDAVSERRPGMPLALMPALDDAAAYLRGRMREGDLVLTVGAGDVRRVGDALLR